MSDVIQVRSDDIEEIQKTFNKEADAIGEMRSKVVGVNDRLKQGWKGLGSEAWFKEADEKTLPSLQRLEEALDQASQTVGKIHKDFGAAEAQAASPVRNADRAQAPQSAAAQNGQATQAGAGQQGAGGQ